MATKELTGNSILIAGASGGLGSALAGQLALLARDIFRLEALLVEGLRLAADISNSESCRAAVSRVLEE